MVFFFGLYATWGTSILTFWENILPAMSRWLNLIQVEAEVDGKEVKCHLHREDGEYVANQSSGSGEEQG